MANLEKTIDALKKNNINVLRFQTGAEAKDAALKMIPGGSSVAFGGSATTAQIGLMDALRSGGYNLIDAYASGVPREEAVERRRLGLLADYFITGTNAITESGELVNIDGLGNRVAAQIFGPRKVFIFVSEKKIVPDVKEAFMRIEKIAAPLNAKRLGIDVPCVRGESCLECPPERTLCKYAVVIRRQSLPERMTIFLIAEDLGY